MIKFRCLPFENLSIRELYLLMALRQEVFVVEQDCPYLDADGKDQAALHLLGESGEHLAAYCRILPEGVSYDGYVSIGRVVTSAQSRGKGFGKLLLAEAIRQAEKKFPGKDIKISAQSYLIAFYEGFGFKAVGSEYLEDNIPHTAMIKTA